MPTLSRPITAHGAVVDLLVAVTALQVHGLRRALKAIPQPVQIEAVIDTGSPLTCIDFQAIQSLGPVASGTVPVLTGSTGPVPITCEQCDLHLTIVHPTGSPGLNLVIPSFLVTNMPLLATGVPALIGRDLLRRCDYCYRGRAGLFTLDY
jgi:hypothetical protein